MDDLAYPSHKSPLASASPGARADLAYTDDLATLVERVPGALGGQAHLACVAGLVKLVDRVRGVSGSRAVVVGFRGGQAYCVSPDATICPSAATKTRCPLWSGLSNGLRDGPRDDLRDEVQGHLPDDVLPMADRHGHNRSHSTIRKLACQPTPRPLASLDRPCSTTDSPKTWHLEMLVAHQNSLS